MKRYITIKYFKEDFGFVNADDQNTQMTDEQMQFFIDRASSYIDRNIVGRAIEKGIISGLYTNDADGNLNPADITNKEEVSKIDAFKEAVAMLAKFGIDTGFDFLTGSFSNGQGQMQYSETFDYETSFQSLIKTLKEMLAGYEWEISTTLVSGGLKVAFDDEYDDPGTVPGSDRPWSEKQIKYFHSLAHTAGFGIKVKSNNDGTVEISIDDTKVSSVKYYSANFDTDWQTTYSNALNGKTSKAGDQFRFNKAPYDYYGFAIDGTKNIEGLIIEGSKVVGAFVLNYAGNTVIETFFNKIPFYTTAEWNALDPSQKKPGTIAYIEGATTADDELILILTNGSTYSIASKEDIVKLQTEIDANKVKIADNKTEIDANKAQIAINGGKIDGVGQWLGTYRGAQRGDTSVLPTTANIGDRCELDFFDGTDLKFQEYRWEQGADPSATGWNTLGVERDTHIHSTPNGITLAQVAQQQDPKIATAKQEAITEAKNFTITEFRKVVPANFEILSIGKGHGTSIPINMQINERETKIIGLFATTDRSDNNVSYVKIDKFGRAFWTIGNQSQKAWFGVDGNNVVAHPLTGDWYKTQYEFSVVLVSYKV